MEESDRTTSANLSKDSREGVIPMPPSEERFLLRYPGNKRLPEFPDLLLTLRRMAPDCFHDMVKAYSSPKMSSVLCREPDDRHSAYHELLFRLRGGAMAFVIPRTAECLTRSMINGQMRTVTFEADSWLTWIEGNAFKGCLLHSLAIPKSVEWISDSALSCPVASITVEDGNRRFCIQENFLFDRLEAKAVRYFGTNDHVVIPKDVRLMSPNCFHSVQLVSWRCEEASQLTQIGEACFRYATFKSVSIPPLVAAMERKCFFGAKIGRSTFEAASQLTRIDESCFEGCSLKLLWIPAY
jgi:hypothetical protein